MDAETQKSLGEELPSEIDGSRRILPLPLEKWPPLEPIYVPDADVDLAQGDIDHLCKVWAEVGRAILTRRKQEHATLQKQEGQREPGGSIHQGI